MKEGAARSALFFLPSRKMEFSKTIFCCAPSWRISRKIQFSKTISVLVLVFENMEILRRARIAVWFSKTMIFCQWERIATAKNNSKKFLKNLLTIKTDGVIITS